MGKSAYCLFDFTVSNQLDSRTLPAKIAEASIKQQLSDLLLASRSKCKLIDISFEHAGDATRALLLLKE